MMGAFAEYSFIGVLWVLAGVLMGHVHPYLMVGWLFLGLLLAAVHAGSLMLRVRKLVKQHPNLRWKLP